MHVEALPSLVVIDASVGLKWVVDEPGSDMAVALVAGRTLITSALFWVEAANALATKQRRGELDRVALEDAWCDLSQAPLRSVPIEAAGAAAALALAAELRHPVYDCCYLQLAMARGTVMVTADRRFQRLIEPHTTLAGRVVPLDEIEPGPG
jgi:predicted nucleic acid-binding protein